MIYKNLFYIYIFFFLYLIGRGNRGIVFAGRSGAAVIVR